MSAWGPGLTVKVSMGAGPLCKSQHNYTCNSVAHSHQSLPDLTLQKSTSMPQCSKLLSQLYFIGVCFLVLLKSKHDKQTTNVRAQSEIQTFQLLFPIFNRTIEPSPSRSGSILGCGWCGAGSLCSQSYHCLRWHFPSPPCSALWVTTMQCTVSHHHVVHCEKCEK